MEVTLHGFRTDRKKKMDCKQVQSGIIDFINDNMDIKEMEQFISHIESCEECREEYDVYYTLIMGMKLLDSDNLRGKTQIDSQAVSYTHLECAALNGGMITVAADIYKKKTERK